MASAVIGGFGFACVIAEMKRESQRRILSSELFRLADAWQGKLLAPEAQSMAEDRPGFTQYGTR